MKKLAIRLLKIGISVAILAVLIYNAREQLLGIGAGEKKWHFLALGLLLCLNSTLICHVRWFFLVRALGIPIRLLDAFRLGFLGYALNYASLGSVGGDVFKAIFLAREQPNHKAEAVATVMVDRLIGLYALFVVASVAVLAGGLYASSVPPVAATGNVTLIVTAISTVVGVLLMLPIWSRPKVQPTGNQPTGHPTKAAKVWARLLGAVQMYRRSRRTMLLTTFMSFAVHTSTALAVYCISQGLPLKTPEGLSLAPPSLGQHFLIVPLAILAGAAPLPFAGLGAFEGALVALYSLFLPTAKIAADTGTLVALTYRAITIIIAIIGFCYYLANRALVRQLMARAEEEEEEMEEELSHERQEAASTV